jgi:hypothetical protein
MGYIKSHEVNLERTVSFDIDIKEVYEKLDQFEQQEFIEDVLGDLYGPEKIGIIINSLYPLEEEKLYEELKDKLKK